MGLESTSLEGVVDTEILALEEELNGKTIETFRAKAETAFEAGRCQIILDGKALKTVSSEGLEALLWLLTEAQSRGGLVKIASLGKIPRKVFEVTQFDRVFDLYDDVISALKNL
ncbi:MAG: STAS domain-containing protein [Planctomycetes bacterium]|nr:STAS domain-containing protein [Planctomycetota bacterium]